MRRLCPLLALVLATAAASAGEANPYLELLQRSERLRAGLRPLERTPLGLLPLPTRPELVPLLIESDAPLATAEAVRALGGRSARPVGRILPVRAPLGALAALAARPEVQRLEGQPPRQARLERSRPEIRADQVELGTDLPRPLTGQGVLVALVDTGVDFRHPDFLSATGRTRVQLVWDQAFGSGEPPPGQTTGSLCDRTSLVRGTCTSIDLIGHGTHVMATMASSGTAYRGMAPEADLMAVASLDFSLLVESVDWLFQQAADRGQPMVVNLSLGGHYGPHDGTSLEDRALYELTGPGRIVLASAGNEGADLIHLGYDPQGGTGKTRFEVFSGLDASVALFTTWLAPDARLEFAVGVERAGLEVAETPFAAAAGAASSRFLLDGDTLLGQVHFEPARGPDPGNGKHQIDIAVEPEAGAFSRDPAGYAWYLKVRGQGAFDSWSAAATAFTPPARFSDQTEGGLVPGDNRKSVGMPAVAPGLLAVGSYATRASWVDANGEPRAHPETVEGQISFFSSLGPSADPDRTGQKPLIAAPGEFIAAAMSQSSAELAPGTRLGPEHVLMRGTSMSCPHAAGVVALLLEARPELDPAGAAEILARTARRDAATGGELPDDTWGHGKLDALEAAALALGVGVCAGPEDCAEGWRCGGGGRCEAPSGGCATGGGGRSAAGCLALGLLLLSLRRRPDPHGHDLARPREREATSSRRGWSRSAPGRRTRRP